MCEILTQYSIRKDNVLWKRYEQKNQTEKRKKKRGVKYYQKTKVKRRNSGLDIKENVSLEKNEQMLRETFK